MEQLRKEVAFLRNDVDHIRVCMQDMHREVCAYMDVGTLIGAWVGWCGLNGWVVTESVGHEDTFRGGLRSIPW